MAWDSTAGPDLDTIADAGKWNTTAYKMYCNCLSIIDHIAYSIYRVYKERLKEMIYIGHPYLV